MTNTIKTDEDGIAYPEYRCDAIDRYGSRCHRVKTEIDGAPVCDHHAEPSRIAYELRMAWATEEVLYGRLRHLRTALGTNVSDEVARLLDPKRLDLDLYLVRNPEDA